jgi:alginate O-acetyltransferase complex protein AlgI
LLFNSIHFLLFFPVVTAAYFLVPFRLRWFWLLAASCYFYMAFRPVYILILAFTILVDYFAGIGIEQAQGKRRKHLLILSIVANVGVLAVFKYYNFLNANLSEVTKWLGGSNPIPFLDMLLPIGLSFHTFQSLSYTGETRRRNIIWEHLPFTSCTILSWLPGQLKDRRLFCRSFTRNIDSSI